MRKYIAFWRGKKIEVEAETSREAQIKASTILRVKPQKQYEVSVMLADVVHDPAVLGSD